MNAMQKLLDFLVELERRRIWYILHHVREETIMVEVHEPGWFWEVEFFADGQVEVEGFRSTGPLLSGTEAEDAMARILSEHDEDELAEGRPPLKDAP